MHLVVIQLCFVLNTSLFVIVCVLCVFIHHPSERKQKVQHHINIFFSFFFSLFISADFIFYFIKIHACMPKLLHVQHTYPLTEQSRPFFLPCRKLTITHALPGKGISMNFAVPKACMHKNVVGH